MRDALAPILGRLRLPDEEIALSDHAIMNLAKADGTARRLMSVPGIGPVTASAIAASVQDVGLFSGPREFTRLAPTGRIPRQRWRAIIRQILQLPPIEHLQ